MPQFIPLSGYPEYSDVEIQGRAARFRANLQRRRSIRQFSDRPVPLQVIEDCLVAAGSAPSGANLQPWHFAVVADPQVKQRLRIAAEAEEREFYAHRATPEWLRVLEPLSEFTTFI